MFDFTVILAVVLIVVITKFWFNNRRNLPPGAFGLPLVGYLPFLTRKPHIKLHQLRKKYGPVYSLYFGTQRTVILCDYNVIKEALLQDAMMGRPPTPFRLHKETIETGAINGMAWKEQRRFAIHMFRDLGLGKSVMEAHIREEIHELLGRIENEVGKPVNVSKMLSPSTSNNISSLVFGKRRVFDDPKRVALDDSLRTVGSLVGILFFLNLFPFLKPIIYMLKRRTYAAFWKALDTVDKYTKEEVAEHQRTLDPNNIRDFVDGYLLEIDKKKSIPGTSFQVPVMIDIVKAFFGAGSDTVRVTMDWLLLVSAGFQDVQKRVNVEIDNVIGRERFPSKEDQTSMPYTTSVIMEILRWITIIPLNFPRYTLKDTFLCSYFIPKHTHVIANIWSVHHDPLLWGEDTEEFRPERFLSEDGRNICKPEFFIPFSTGKRACPGESLALTEVFLYFAAILQKFYLRLPKGIKADFDGQPGFGLQPKPYELIMEIRK